MSSATASAAGGSTRRRGKKKDDGALAVPVAGPTRYDLAREELTRLSAETGRLAAEDVVEHARDEGSPLHSFFTWNDDEAAEKYRLMQAGVLIRRVKITIVRRDAATRQIDVESVRAFQSPASERDRKGEPKKGGSQIPSSRIARDPDLRKSLVETVLSELIAIRKRYREVSELGAVWSAIDEATAN